MPFPVLPGSVTHSSRKVRLFPFSSCSTIQGRAPVPGARVMGWGTLPRDPPGRGMGRGAGQAVAGRGRATAQYVQLGTGSWERHDAES